MDGVEEEGEQDAPDLGALPEEEAGVQLEEGAQAAELVEGKEVVFEGKEFPVQGRKEVVREQVARLEESLELAEQLLAQVEQVGTGRLRTVFAEESWGYKRNRAYFRSLWAGARTGRPRSGPAGSGRRRSAAPYRTRGTSSDPP